MREEAHFANSPAPQAPARNPAPSHTSTLETFNSHRQVRRPRLGERKVYRPVRRHTLSRIDETPPDTLGRPKSLQNSADISSARPRSLQISTDFSSTRPMNRSRSTSRSFPVCNQSQDIDTESPQYADPKYDSGSSYEDRPASMTDLPIMVPMDPVTGAYIPYPEYAYYHDDGCRLNRLKWKCKKKQSKNNLFLAFMY